MERENVRMAAAGVLSGGKLRQLEEKGMTVVYQDELERLKKIEKEAGEILDLWKASREVGQS
ncbi:hypothetical protein [Paludifilum halophilum]|nr:hypothetical protein [Paludifilum halophilum]